MYYRISKPRPRTIVFDCDGVILDSNKIKADAFREIALPFGSEAAEKIVRYHAKYGGLSRYKKFEYLLSDVLNQPASVEVISQLSRQFSERVFSALLSCPLTGRLKALRDATADMNWMVVSGADQEELRSLFKARNLDHLFNGGIFGSPDSKDEILQAGLEQGKISKPALFVGDSSTDFEAAEKAGLDFLFVFEWTGDPNWKEYTSERSIAIAKEVSDLLFVL